MSKAYVKPILREDIRSVQIDMGRPSGQGRAAIFDETTPCRGHKIDNGIRMIGHTDSKLVGTWKLVSASSKTSAGDRNDAPYGLTPVGFLTYTEDGRVAAMISYDGRKPLAFGGPSLATIEQQAEAFKTFLAYAGRYTLDDDKVIHSIEISSIQNYVGKELVRSISFQGDQITLVTPPTSVNGKIQTVELIWKRLSVGS